MDFYDLIRTRRSIRCYDKNKKVPEPVLKRVLEAGRLAPTAGNRQPSRIILVKDEATLAKIAPCYKREWFADAAALLIVLGSRANAWKRQSDGFNSLEIDCAIMMDHMILAAEYEGLSSCWVIAFDHQPIREVLDISDDEFICCLAPLGYPPDGYEKPKMPQRKKLEDMAEII